MGLALLGINFFTFFFFLTILNCLNVSNHFSHSIDKVSFKTNSMSLGFGLLEEKLWTHVPTPQNNENFVSKTF